MLEMTSWFHTSQKELFKLMYLLITYSNNVQSDSSTVYLPGDVYLVDQCVATCSTCCTQTQPSTPQPGCLPALSESQIWYDVII